jgi:hypothetical protein
VNTLITLRRFVPARRSERGVKRRQTAIPCELNADRFGQASVAKIHDNRCRGQGREYWLGKMSIHKQKAATRTQVAIGSGGGFVRAGVASY